MNAHAIMCPTCGVPDGPCLDNNGRIAPTHGSRIRNARELALYDGVVPMAAKAVAKATSSGWGGKRQRGVRMPADLRRQKANEYSKKRRAENKQAGSCINHSDRKATDGVLCRDCRVTHRATNKPRTMDERRRAA